jgi:hypothetical protein
MEEIEQSWTIRWGVPQLMHGQDKHVSESPRSARTNEYAWNKSGVK